MGALEAIFYAIARGCVRAYFDVMDDRQIMIEEVPNAVDRVRARRFRDAVNRVRALEAGATGSNDPAQGREGGAGNGGVPAP